MPAVPARNICPDCAGFVGVRPSYKGSRGCQCGVPQSERKPGGTFAQWYLRENPELVERLTEVEHDTDPQSGWPRVAA